MEIQIWWIWMIFAAVFVIGEIFTAGFFILWFGVGAAAAGVIALLGFSPAWQWGSFVLVSGVLLIVSRRFAERFTKKQPPGIGADRFVGNEAVVLEKINTVKNTGRIRLDREEWRAESDAGDVIPVGERVKVVRIEGTHLVVTPVKEGE